MNSNRTVHTTLRHLLILIILPALLGALLPSAGAMDQNERSSSPADFGSASCFDVVTADGVVHLLFGQTYPPDRNELNFFYTRSEDEGQTWSQPIRVFTDHAPPGRHQRGHDPQLAVAGNQLLALWTARGGGPWGSGRLAAALSSDGGRTWHKGPAPGIGANATEAAGFRFPAVAADEERFHVVWIHAHDLERSLRYAQLRFGRKAWTAPTVIDPEICACCWNQLQVAEDGTLVALYRDQDPSDMSLAVSDDKGETWRRVGPAGNFDWQFNGCPHVGGGLALGTGPFATSPLLATVWTGHPEKGGAYVLHSNDTGQTWQRSPIPGNNLPGHVHTDAARLSNDRAAIIWDRTTGDDGKAIFVATMDTGQSWSEPRMISGDREKNSHPRIVASGNGFLAFWSEKAADGLPRLRMKRVK